MKRQEIEALRTQYPDLFYRAIAIEDNAMPHLTSVKGLGRSYSWRERFVQEDTHHDNGRNEKYRPPQGEQIDAP